MFGMNEKIPITNEEMREKKATIIILKI